VDGHGAAGHVDAAALPRAAGGHATAADRLVVGQGAAGQGQGGAAVVDAPAQRGRAGRGGQVAIGDGQPGEGDGHPGPGDVEDPAGVVAADRQLIGPRSLDVQAPGDGQLAAGQGDGLAAQGRVEVDGVAALGGGDGGPQRAGAAVGVVQHRQGAGQPARLQPLQPGAEPGPPGWAGPAAGGRRGQAADQFAERGRGHGVTPSRKRGERKPGAEPLRQAGDTCSRTAGAAHRYIRKKRDPMHRNPNSFSIFFPGWPTWRGFDVHPSSVASDK
jgi:hypothetical protein